MLLVLVGMAAFMIYDALRAAATRPAAMSSDTRSYGKVLTHGQECVGGLAV